MLIYEPIQLHILVQSFIIANRKHSRYASLWEYKFWISMKPPRATILGFCILDTKQLLLIIAADVVLMGVINLLTGILKEKILACCSIFFLLSPCTLALRYITELPVYHLSCLYTLLRNHGLSNELVGPSGTPLRYQFCIATEYIHGPSFSAEERRPCKTQQDTNLTDC